MNASAVETPNDEPENEYEVQSPDHVVERTVVVERYAEHHNSYKEEHPNCDEMVSPQSERIRPWWLGFSHAGSHWLGSP
jgi:hypothetical protein